MGLRALTAHHVSPLDKALSIHALDVPGQGGANHQYFIAGLDTLMPITALQRRTLERIQRGVEGTTQA